MKNKEEKELEHKLKLEQAKKEGRIVNNKICGTKLSIYIWNKRKELILNSGIDISKFGWVGKMSKKIGLSGHQIKDTINHFISEFKGKFFRRKS